MRWYISIKFFAMNFLLDFYSGQWDMNNQKLYQCAPIKSWGILVYGEGLPVTKINGFKDRLRRAA